MPPRTLARRVGCAGARLPTGTMGITNAQMSAQPDRWRWMAIRFEWRFRWDGDHRQPGDGAEKIELSPAIEMSDLPVLAGVLAIPGCLGERVGGYRRPGARELPQNAQKPALMTDRQRDHQHHQPHHHHPRFDAQIMVLAMLFFGGERRIALALTIGICFGITVESW